MSSALIFVTGGSMKSYITGAILGGAYLMLFMQMWFLGREYMKDKEKYLQFKGKFLNKMEKRVQVLLFGELKLAMQYK